MPTACQTVPEDAETEAEAALEHCCKANLCRFLRGVAGSIVQERTRERDLLSKRQLWSELLSTLFFLSTAAYTLIRIFQLSHP